MYFQTSKNQTYCKQQWNGLATRQSRRIKRKRCAFALSRIASTVKSKSITFSKIGESAETNSEFVTTGETCRIIMRDGFYYFAATE
jgi:hypothetical protein